MEDLERVVNGASVSLEVPESTLGLRPQPNGPRVSCGDFLTCTLSDVPWN
jgi:hypothetical protein